MIAKLDKLDNLANSRKIEQFSGSLNAADSVGLPRMKGPVLRLRPPNAQQLIKDKANRTDADGGIRHIEGGKVHRPPVEIQKVHDVAVP